MYIFHFDVSLCNWNLFLNVYFSHTIHPDLSLPSLHSFQYLLLPPLFPRFLQERAGLSGISTKFSITRCNKIHIQRIVRGSRSDPCRLWEPRWALLSWFCGPCSMHRPQTHRGLVMGKGKLNRFCRKTGRVETGVGGIRWERVGQRAGVGETPRVRDIWEAMWKPSTSEIS